MKVFTIAFWKHHWQELVFITAIGLMLLEMMRYYGRQNALDGLDVALLVVVLPVFLALLGQLFWKHRGLSTVLSIVLSLGAIVFLAMALYFLFTTAAQQGKAILMGVTGIFLLFTAFSMGRRRA